MKDIIARPEEAMNVTSDLLLHGLPTNKPGTVISEILDGCFVNLTQYCKNLVSLSTKSFVTPTMQVIVFIKCSTLQ